MQAGVFVDSVRHFSVVRHEERSVIGFSTEVCPVLENQPYCRAEDRSLDRSVAEAVDETLASIHGRSLPFRMTAGVEPRVWDAEKGDYQSDIIHYVKQLPDHPKVFVAVPGRATRVWTVAEDELIPEIERVAEDAPVDDLLSCAANEWSGAVQMHYESVFDGDLNDCES